MTAKNRVQKHGTGGQMFQIDDAPWIREAEATGHYKYGWWNTPDYETEDDEDEEDCVDRL